MQSKKPKAENVIFYDTSQQAIQYGFRPCKICKPMNLEGETPDYINNLINEFQQSVWEVLQQIPYGDTWSYKEQAIKLNIPKAVRAFVTANGYNRIALLSFYS